MLCELKKKPLPQENAEMLMAKLDRKERENEIYPRSSAIKVENGKEGGHFGCYQTKDYNQRWKKFNKIHEERAQESK